MAGYPAEREADVVLRDGSTLRLRPVRPTDRAALLEFFAGLDQRSRAFRFFSGAADLELAAAEMAAVDYVSSYGIVATREERIVGHGLYVTTSPGRAEVAFAIDAAVQGHGLGTILLAHLAEAAHESGISTLTATVLAQNHQMIEVFRESGFPLRTRSLPGEVEVELPSSFSPAAIARFEERDRLAARAAARCFLEPGSIAVVGASRRPDRVGGAVLHNILASGFRGPLFAVNPGAEEVQSLPAYPSIAAVPGEVELAVVAVPADAAVAVARECGAKGVRGLVVLSAGFAEVGASGAERERELLGVCREHGMRLLGPNCLGVLGPAGANLNATFAPSAPPAGNVGFATQSGALGLALIELAGERQIGVSSFASLGNRADLSANDLLEYWEEDPATAVALLYIESFSDPRRFARVARRVGRRKPIVVVKSGRSASGARAAASHTGALLAGSERAADALFAQAGVIRTETLAEMLDVVTLLSSQPLPAGRRVGILTNAGGPGIMCADACEAAGLEVPEAPPRVREQLRRFLPAEASSANPVDMIATAGAEHYRRAIAALAAWEGIDALIVIFIRPLSRGSEDIPAAVGAALAELPRPLAVQAVFMSPADRGAASEARAPTYQFPEDAARALGRAAAHSRWRQAPTTEAPALPGVRADEASAVIAEGLADEEDWLGTAALARLLDCYGIPVPRSRTAAGPRAAAEAAEEIGGPVALKAIGPSIVHKTELGAVRLGLRGPEEVAAAATLIEDSLERAGVSRESFLVQEMAGEGVELLVGIASDPVFGPVIACGAGGVAAELADDVAVRICPLQAGDPAQMLGSLRIEPLLSGYRGAEAVDVEALEELLLRIGAMAEAHRELVELDLNPVIAGPAGALAVDARVRVERAPAAAPWPGTWTRPAPPAQASRPGRASIR